MVFVPRFASPRRDRSLPNAYDGNNTSSDLLVSSSDKSAYESSVVRNDTNSGMKLMRSEMYCPTDQKIWNECFKVPNVEGRLAKTKLSTPNNKKAGTVHMLVKAPKHG